MVVEGLREGGGRSSDWGSGALLIKMQSALRILMK